MKWKSSSWLSLLPLQQFQWGHFSSKNGWTDLGSSFLSGWNYNDAFYIKAAVVTLRFDAPILIKWSWVWLPVRSIFSAMCSQTSISPAICTLNDFLQYKQGLYPKLDLQSPCFLLDRLNYSSVNACVSSKANLFEMRKIMTAMGFEPGQLILCHDAALNPLMTRRMTWRYLFAGKYLFQLGFEPRSFETHLIKDYFHGCLRPLNLSAGCSGFGLHDIDISPRNHKEHSPLEVMCHFFQPLFQVSQRVGKYRMNAQL